MPHNNDLKDVGGIDEPKKNEQTPENRKSGKPDDEAASPAAFESPDQNQQQYSPGSGQNSSGKKTRYKGKGVDANGRPRNFYNPPGKVLRSLANQSYYDSFYGNQGQIYTLKQKYKTQLCKHYLENE